MQQISLIQEAQEAQDDDIVCVQEVAAKIKKEPTATQKMVEMFSDILSKTSYDYAKVVGELHVCVTWKLPDKWRC